MKLTGRSVLITGGSEGIGFELARMLANDNQVVICGRSEEKLARAAESLPNIHTEVCDVTDAEQRLAMLQRVLTLMPNLDVLVNNAGAKTPTDLRTGEGAALAMHQDMALNFTAPASLALELLPHLREQPQAAVVNMTTGLIYLAKAEQAFYCAAKSALHSFSQSLRWSLRGSTVAVHEVMLTLVDTNFHRGALPKNIPAITAREAAERTLTGLRRGRSDIHVGKAGLARWLALLAPERGLAVVNGAG